MIDVVSFSAMFIFCWIYLFPRVKSIWKWRQSSITEWLSLQIDFAYIFLKSISQNITRMGDLFVQKYYFFSRLYCRCWYNWPFACDSQSSALLFTFRRRLIEVKTNYSWYKDWSLIENNAEYWSCFAATQMLMHYNLSLRHSRRAPLFNFLTEGGYCNEDKWLDGRSHLSSYKYSRKLII